MKNLLTPYEIEVLLYYYSGGGIIDKNSNAFKNAIIKFKKAGMLMEDTPAGTGPVFKTEPLELYINELRKVKLPVQVWVIPPDELEM